LTSGTCELSKERRRTSAELQENAKHPSEGDGNIPDDGRNLVKHDLETDMSAARAAINVPVALASAMRFVLGLKPLSERTRRDTPEGREGRLVPK
jgi:hypothetical protein